ncbi:hypothetical protein ACJMK2_010291 [Sinanodonta woodiana]|uniref:GPI transamidase component PIG-T n=1 Tax=Sinanodonta woodiana TaxID=1069815 RepID=A0ABD3VG61_SINWO
MDASIGPWHRTRCLLYFKIIFLFFKVYALPDDTFSEELLVKPFESGQVLFHFQFTTLWNASTAEPGSFTHYRLFPKALGDVLVKYQVQELHLSLTQGLWRYEKWGYPPEDAPPGVELWVWFLPTVSNIDKTWSDLVNALSGLFCASLNFMDSKSTVLPRWSFRPMGLASEYYSFDSRFMRYSALPKEIVCTENLTPWKKLLPCLSRVGLATLLNAMKLYDSYYSSLGIHVRPVCRTQTCTDQSIELKQTLSVVFDPTISSSGYQNWQLRSLFGDPLTSQCPLASISKVYLDKAHLQSSDATVTLYPEPDEVVNFTRGREKLTYAVWDIGRQISRHQQLNLAIHYNRKIHYGEINPPPVYAQRFITGFGLEKGGITSIIYNNLDTNLTAIYMETIPWFLRLYFSSITITNHGIVVKPYKIHYVPGKDRARNYQLELVFRLRPHSVTKISMQFERAFLKWTEYPPDANHGFYVNSAIISTVLPDAYNYTASPQTSSLLGDSTRDNSTEFFLRLHTETLLVSLPTPDFSMPYNVICLACTVVAIVFGSIHNLTTRRFIAVDPDKQVGIIQKIKNKFKRNKPEEIVAELTASESVDQKNESDIKTKKKEEMG